MKKYLLDTSELANMKLFRSVSNREGLWVVELRGFMLTAFGNVANLGTRRLELAELARIRQDFSINPRISPLSFDTLTKSVRVASSAVFWVNAYLFARIFLINEIYCGWFILFEVR